MTEPEVKQKADEAVEMFFRDMPRSTNYLEALYTSIKCAILMYEEIVKLAESVDLYFRIDELKAILTELKSRI